MAVSYDEVEKFLRGEVATITGRGEAEVTADTGLIGPQRVVDSADLVMLLLAVEDFAREQLSAEFDWTSDSAMSEARSNLRSVGALAQHLMTLQAP